MARLRLREEEGALVIVLTSARLMVDGITEDETAATTDTAKGVGAGHWGRGAGLDWLTDDLPQRVTGYSGTIIFAG